MDRMSDKNTVLGVRLLTKITITITALKRVELDDRRPTIPLQRESSQSAIDTTMKKRESWIAIERLRTSL